MTFALLRCVTPIHAQPGTNRDRFDTAATRVISAQTSTPEEYFAAHRQLKKGEFESTQAYRSRIAPLANSIVALLAPQSACGDGSFSYDADSHRMTVGKSYNLTDHALEVADVRYEAGSNARMSPSDQRAGMNRVASRAFRIHASFARVSDYGYSVKRSWSVPVDSARVLKPNLCVLFVLAPALFSTGELIEVEKTYHDNAVQETLTVHARRLWLWVYDPRSGAVLKKFELGSTRS